MNYEYRPSEWVGADTRYAQADEHLRQLRRIFREFMAEDAPGGPDLIKAMTYLLWLDATVNRLKEAR